MEVQQLFIRLFVHSTNNPLPQLQDWQVKRELVLNLEASQQSFPKKQGPSLEYQGKFYYHVIEMKWEMVWILLCRDKSGVRDVAQAAEARKRMKMHQRKLAKDGRQGESDRRILNNKPKHLFAGKRKSGKTGRR